MAKSNEPAVWLLFSAGGMLSALLVPILIVVTGFVAPAGGVTSGQLATVFSGLLVRIALFLLAFLTFFHAAHRLRFTLVDVGLKSLKTPITWICYLAAVVGSVWSATVMFF